MRYDETVREVCADDVARLENGESLCVKGIENSCVAKCAWMLDGHIRALSDHYGREMAAKDAEIARLNDELFAYAGGHVITGAERCLKEKNGQLESRIALLERALKPVMECDTESEDVELGDCDSVLVAVEEAQRVMREGGEK